MSQTAVIGRAAESFVIEGGRPLHGRIRASGNKNGALPILAACLLTAEPVRLHNVPRIVDVETMIELLNDIGVEADWIGPSWTRTSTPSRSSARISISVDVTSCVGARFAESPYFSSRRV